MLDSRDKRAAGLQFLQPWLFTPPLPDATLSAADRDHLGRLYRGIALSIPGGLNSRERRASALEYLQTGVFAPPLPDATLATPDRYQLRTLYSGFSASTISGWDDGSTVWDDGVAWDQPSLVNTRDRRASVVSFLQTGKPRALPLADATIGATDRESVANLYRGFALQSGIVNHLDTRNKRASALQFLQTGVSVMPLPDATISALDRQQVAHLYAGIAALFGVPLYTGSGVGMRSSSLTSAANASNVAYAGNSASFMRSLCVLMASGNYSIVFDPSGTGQALSDSVITAAGAYVGDSAGTGDTLLSASSLAGSGTFTVFTGLSSGSAFVVSNALLSAVGSYGSGTTDITGAIEAIAVELGPDRLVTFIEALRAICAVLCGDTSGTPTTAGTMGYRAIGNPTVERISGDEDGRGTRESVVLTLDP